MKIGLTLLMTVVILTGCQFSKSVKKDLISGLLTTGDGLSCDNVYLTVDSVRRELPAFTFGEKISLNFNNIEGFKKENGAVFPGMKIYVISTAGDTVLNTDDLYSEYKGGVTLSPLLLLADLTVASPIRSNNEYSLHVNIWDKKSTGKFNAKLNFKVTPNRFLNIESNIVKYDEIYLFSKERGKVIPGNNIRSGENTYIIFEGLSGFKAENGNVNPGLSLKATDSEGKIVLSFDDLFAEYSADGLTLDDFNNRVSSHFNLNGIELKNPLHCELVIWDKKSPARLKASADLVVK
jgi:hypothetical protein